MAYDCLEDKVVKAFASRTADPVINSRFLHGDFSGSSRTSYIKVGTTVATLPGVWYYRVRAGTGWPSVITL